MIIIEGPDNAGKSTLATQLSLALGIPIHHSGGPAQNEDEIVNRAEIVFDNNGHKIFDRVPFISDYVYRTVMQDKPSPFTDIKLVHRYIKRMKKQHPVVIFCWPPKHVMLSLEGHSKSEHETQEHFDRVKAHQHDIVNLYEELFKDIPHYKYNYMASALEDQFATILMACVNKIKREI